MLRDKNRFIIRILLILRLLVTDSGNGHLLICDAKLYIFLMSIPLVTLSVLDFCQNSCLSVSSGCLKLYKVLYFQAYINYDLLNKVLILFANLLASGRGGGQLKLMASQKWSIWNPLTCPGPVAFKCFVFLPHG